ncbi:CRTAC1 family protein [Lyngbya sp. PCC 8106]|uniref:CRTAC1 family protein n=1 Tax=Lyngbya sp. (strain PCC 8106) TaxID=313612 RepID=UPI0000EACDFE|nr:CRTAC1 family protein [Lyngbya sp. PCC 8106]EAW35514.1 Integrin alpha chain [Lyngbya sp. PCC 8106]
MNKKFVRFSQLFFTAFITILLITFAWKLWSPTIKTLGNFSPKPTPLTATYDIFDLGVVDANNDNIIDVFTLNHSARQNLLLGSESGEFVDVLSDWNLDQDRQFAWSEDTDIQPPINSPGLYIYRQNFDLHIRANQLQNLDKLRGTLKLSLPIEVKKNHLAEANIQENTSAGKNQTTVDFSVQNNGELVLQGFPEILHSFEITQNIPLEQIYIGFQKQPPESYNFDLMWRDRHSMAWTDFNRDGYKDVFIGRGAVRGKMADLSERFTDELFVSRNDITLQDQAEKLGFLKEGCPGRQSAWVDFNNDDRLDLYTICGRSKDDPIPYRNQLYQQTTNGQFINVASQVGLDLPQAGYMFWFDADNDKDMDLLTSQEENVYLYLNEAGKFQQRFSETLNKSIIKFAVSDYDLDGDFDVYIVTAGENALLINTEGKYTLTNPNSIGLPSKGLTANWVDYNNDSLPDLHVVPSGLYSQNAQHTFEETQLLDMRFPKFNTWNARSVWFDANNDGARDVIIAFQQTPSILQETPSLKDRILNQIQKRDTSRIWQSRFYQNKISDHHWLEVKLIGSPGNPEAIGAKVQVKTADKTQVQQIGSSENSHYSQGHYRLYFGLGKQDKPDSIQVIWPDGTVKTIAQPVADQLLTIEKNTK